MDQKGVRRQRLRKFVAWTRRFARPARQSDLSSGLDDHVSEGISFVKTIALLGSTGSIGVSTLALVREFPDRFRVHGMVAGRNPFRLAQQINAVYTPCG